VSATVEGPFLSSNKLNNDLATNSKTVVTAKVTEVSVIDSQRFNNSS
jgi:hypothetical protein